MVVPCPGLRADVGVDGPIDDCLCIVPENHLVQVLRANALDGVVHCVRVEVALVKVRDHCPVEGPHLLTASLFLVMHIAKHDGPWRSG